MEYLYDYLLFAAKALTVVLALALPAGVLLLLAGTRRRRPSDLTLEVRRLNDRLEDAGLALEAAMLPRARFRQRLKQLRHARKARAADPAGEGRKRVFVCHFVGDLRANAVSALREEITAILAVARAGDEVAVVLESAGGTVPGYGLGASQLRRVRDRGLQLTVLVDRIAASGGYMMACVGHEIIAAPFAIIGSIGVVTQLPNFHRLLRKHDIDFEQITAGQYKRTLTLFGENTEADRQKVREEINDAHALFKEFVAAHRPTLDLERVATGEYWFATRALALGLVDALSTSDEFICRKAREADVYRVRARQRRPLRERLGSVARQLAGAR
jgi:serine protease SohB